MEVIVPLVFIGLGSAALLILRAGPLVMGGLLLQWVGLLLVAFLMGGGIAAGVLVAEAITAIACVAILTLTLTNVNYARRPRSASQGAGAAAGLQAQQAGLPGSAEDLWPLVVAVAAAIAGLVLARLYPLGGSEGVMVAFYWTLLAGTLVLVLEGARDPVKLAAGLLALLNSVALLLNTLPGVASDPVALGLMSVGRIALAAILAYSWLLVFMLFSELNISLLFSARDATPSVPDGERDESVEDEDGAATAETQKEITISSDSETAPSPPVSEALHDVAPVEDQEADEEWLKRITPGS
jgi:hypothetical protein